MKSSPLKYAVLVMKRSQGLLRGRPPRDEDCSWCTTSAVEDSKISLVSRALLETQFFCTTSLDDVCGAHRLSPRHKARLRRFLVCARSAKLAPNTYSHRLRTGRAQDVLCRGRNDGALLLNSTVNLDSGNDFCSTRTIKKFSGGLGVLPRSTSWYANSDAMFETVAR